jgi:hypothetical protein
VHVSPRWLAALVLFAASPAYAEGQRVEVEVGHSVELDVGYARGVICDDLTIIDADLHAKTEQTNAFVVTGKALGTTMCRVGTDAFHVHFLFEIHVVAAKSK